MVPDHLRGRIADCQIRVNRSHALTHRSEGGIRDDSERDSRQPLAPRAEVVKHLILAPQEYSNTISLCQFAQQYRRVRHRTGHKQAHGATA